MSIGVYRNILNQEMKRFGKFGKKIVHNLNLKGIDIKLIFEPKLTRCIYELNNHETLILISHGSPDGIYHKYDKKLDNHQSLVNSSNLHLLTGKKVIAISCATARELGKIACEDGGCTSFLGFYNKIHFNKKNGKNPSIRYHMFISDCYKDTFSEVLERAILHNWSFNKIKLVLERELKRIVVTRAQDISEKYPRYYQVHGIEQSVIAVSHVAENIHIFGDGKQKII